MISNLKSFALLKNAAMIAKTFSMDPVEVLNGTFFEYNVRLAAQIYVAEEEKKEADKMKSRK